MQPFYIITKKKLNNYKSRDHHVKKQCFLTWCEMIGRSALSEFAIALTAIYRYMKGAGGKASCSPYSIVRLFNCSIVPRFQGSGVPEFQSSRVPEFQGSKDLSPMLYALCLHATMPPCFPAFPDTLRSSGLRFAPPANYRIIIVSNRIISYQDDRIFIVLNRIISYQSLKCFGTFAIWKTLYIHLS
jgi:hypothetical protein